MRKVLSVLGVLAALVGASLVSGNPDPITADDFVGCLDSYGCVYDIVWDGWKGTLTLKPDGTGSLEQITPRRATYSVRHAIMLNPQNVVKCRAISTTGLYSGWTSTKLLTTPKTTSDLTGTS